MVCHSRIINNGTAAPIESRLKFIFGECQIGSGEMQIYVSHTTYNSYGGGFDKPLTYLNSIISDRFQAENIEFPYREIEIFFAYLSHKVKDARYIEWYSKLPYYHRGKNAVKITLPVPAKPSTLIDIFAHLNKAFDILISKKKKTDTFDSEKVKATLLKLEKDLQSADLYEIHTNYEAAYRQNRIEKVRQNRAAREQSETEKKQLIRDLRFYTGFSGRERPYLDPSDQLLCNDISNGILEKLRENKFRLPGYTHLYIMASDSFENALYESLKLESWHEYGIAVLQDYTNFTLKKEHEKKRIIFDLIKQGLYDIAKIDKLDIDILNEALNEAESKL